MSKQTRVAPGLYRMESGAYATRRTVQGRRELVTLKAIGLQEAIREASLVAGESMSFSELAAVWIQASCPNAHNEPQPQAYCSRAAYMLRHPLAYFGQTPSNAIRPIQIDDYFSYRAKLARAGVTAKRMTDLELTACSSLYRWAYRRELVDRNPFDGRGIRQKEALVSHCTDRAPASADTVHRVASAMFDAGSESCAFLWLFICLTGCRCIELRELRLDGIATGSSQPPGWSNLSSMIIKRAKMRDRAGAIQPIALRPEAQSLLAAWKRWHDSKCSGSAWWFPGLRDGPLDPTSLAHALANVCKRLGIAKVSPHGGRSFHCKVLRSLLPDDRLVADALGHSSVKLVERVYGKRNPNDHSCASFLPSSGAPAWHRWLPKEEAPASIVLLPAVSA